MKKGNILVPVAAILFAVIAFAIVSNFYLYSNDKQSTNTTNVSVVTNTNTSHEETNANVAANTNSSEATGYSSPTGPFDVASSKIFAVAYRQTTDRLVTRLAKINVTTGKTTKEAVLRTTDIQAAAKLTSLPSTPSQFEFGKDGDSVIFVASTENPPTAGIYRTSFSEPTQIETIVQYNQTNLYNDDIPSISSLRFHAETNTLAYTIRGGRNEENNDVLVVNASDKHARKLKSYPNPPSLVGFPENGAQLEVLWQDDDDYEESAKGTWSFDQIRLSDDEVVKNTVVIDESTVKRQVYLSSNNIAPSNKLVVSNIYAQEQRKEALWFRIFSSGQVTANFFDNDSYFSIGPWAPDSGKIALSLNGRGEVYDLAKGSIATIKDYGYGLLWYPGPDLIYVSNDSEIYRYSLSTKKSVEFDDLKISGGGYGDGGGLLGQGWVNR